MIMNRQTPPLFQLGQIVATPQALSLIDENGHSPMEFLTRHQAGDWGLVDTCDRQLNDASVRDGSRLLSAYELKDGTRIWVITEAADEYGVRPATTILLPSEY